MPRFFYSASNLQNYHAPDSWWRRWRKKVEKKRALKRLDANLVEVRNPFKKNIEKKPRPIKLGAIFVALIFFIWLGIMFYLPYFRINKVEFSGLNIIKEEELNNFINTKFLNPVRSWWPSSNYFLLNTSKVGREIKSNFAVEEISVTKVFPNLIKISVREKTTSIIYDNGRDYMLLDENGNFVKNLKVVSDNEFVIENITNTTTPNASTTVSSSNVLLRNTSSSTSILEKIHIPDFKSIKKESGTFPLIYDERIGRENKNNLEKEVVSTVFAWQKLLKGSTVGEPHYFILDNLAAGLKIKTSNPWDILININGNYENAFKNLEAILKDNHPGEYVDLRYGERVYWK